VLCVVLLRWVLVLYRHCGRFGLGFDSKSRGNTGSLTETALSRSWPMLRKHELGLG